MPEKSNAYRAECSPQRVAGELDRLWSHRRGYPPVQEQGWAGVAEWDRWRIGWHQQFQRQWSLLGEWAWATGQPRAVRRAIITAEYAASTAASRAEADLVESERHAAEQAVGGTGVVA